MGMASDYYDPIIWRLQDEVVYLDKALQEIEQRTRPDGDMADQAVNALVRTHIFNREVANCTREDPERCVLREHFHGIKNLTKSQE
jgi:hypothetical protein